MVNEQLTIFRSPRTTTLLSTFTKACMVNPAIRKDDAGWIPGIV
jgi:hypothetical protein